MTPGPLEWLGDLLDPLKLAANPAAQGRGVRVALLDSGVDRRLLEKRAAERGHPTPRIDGALFRASAPTPPALFRLGVGPRTVRSWPTSS